MATGEAARASMAVLYCEHTRSRITLAFYKDQCQLLERWICQMTVGIGKNDKTSKKKKCMFVGMHMRDEMAMKLGSVKQKGTNSIEIKQV